MKVWGMDIGVGKVQALILGALRDQVVSLCFLAFWIFDELFLGRQRKAQQMAWALSFLQSFTALGDNGSR